MSSAYWRMLTLQREPENWYPRSILIEMVSTSVFITVLKMTTDRGSHTLSSSQFVTTPSPLSLSSRRSPYLLCERSHRDRDDTHRTFFLTLEDQRESGDYRGPEAVSCSTFALICASCFPFVLICESYFSFAVPRFTFLVRPPFLVEFPSLSRRASKRYTERNGGV